MTDASIPKGPFFANALHCGSGKTSGFYYFIPDLILIPTKNWAVRSHEVAHRFFARDRTSGSDWLALRRLVGISHAICKNICRLVAEYGLFIHGKRFGELNVSGESPHRETVEELLRWVENIEHIIDAVWRTLVPIAEMAAIDFSEYFEPDNPKSIFNLRKTKLSAIEQEKADKEKSMLIQAAVADYPPSFHESVRQAWAAYNKIEDAYTRKELLRLAMSSFIPVDDKICILDSIKLILDNSAFAYHDAEGASKAFFIERLKRSRAVFTWFEHYIK